MVKQTFKSVGFEFSIDVPSTVEEFDTLAGRQGAALAEAINNVAYRSVLADFRSTLCDKLEETFSIARAMDDEGEKYTEREADYIKRVIADKGEDAVRKVVDAVVGTLIFDPKAKERVTGSKPKKVSERWLKIAQQVEDNGRGAAARQKLGLPADAPLSALAYAIKADVEEQARKQAAAY